MRIPGPSLDDLARLGDRYAGIVTDAARAVLERTARQLPARPTPDDLRVITTRWPTYVDDGVLPELGAALWHGVDVVHGALARHADALVAAVLAPDDLPPLFVDVPGPDAPVDLPPVADRIPRVSSEAAQTYLANRRNALVGIGDDLWTNARAALVDGQRAGEGVAKLKQRVLGSLDVSAPRAQAIARTEVNGAANAGSLMEMHATGLTATKEWIATGDHRTRKDHAHVDGDKVDLDGMFDVGGHAMAGPHDQLGPAREVVNCRCTLGYDVADDEVVKLVNEPDEPLPNQVVVLEAPVSSLTVDQMAALLPANHKSETAIRKAFEQTDAGRNLLALIKRFTQTRGGVTNLRKQMAAYLDGAEQTKATAQQLGDFLHAMNGWSTDEVPQLYRGFGLKIPRDADVNAWFDEFESRYAAGSKLDLNVSSFTSSERKAQGFMRAPGGTLTGTSLVQVEVVVDGPVAALPVERLSKFAYEREWISGGRFEVTKLEKPEGKRGHYVVHIRQVELLRRGG